MKLQQKAGKVGFDWDDARWCSPKSAKRPHEIEEVLPERPDNVPAKELTEEIGDLLFVVANLARHANVDPEQALRGANAKFERRFHHIEARLAQAGRAPGEATLDEMEALWVEAKRLEGK